VSTYRRVLISEATSENASEVRGGEAFTSVFAFHLVRQFVSD